jgi:hypothetical protein
VVNDSVCWLPPSHPRSIVTDSVAQFRFERHAIMQNMDKKTSDSEVSSSIIITIVVFDIFITLLYPHNKCNTSNE